MRKYFSAVLAVALSIAFSCASAANLGDYAPATNVCGKFTTFRPSTGAPFTLAGTPALSVYKDASTTQSTTGVTLTADFDTVTGANHFCVDTSLDGTFYSAGSNFDVIITTGTVDSVSVVGSVVANFTIDKTMALKPTTAGRKLDVSTGGEAGLDWANVGSPTTTLALTGTTISASQVAASVTGNVGGNVTGSVGSVATGGISEASFATTTGSFDALGISRQGTAQGATATTVTLDASAPFGDDTILGQTLSVKGSTNGNYWQSCLVSDWVASTKVATVTCPSGFVTPTGTITFKQWGTAAAGGALDAAGVRAAVGLAAANLDTQLGGIQGDTDNIQTRTPAALVSGRMDASVGAYQTGLTPLQPTVSGRTLDVSTTGEAGLDWANVGAPTTALNLSGTTIATTQSIASVSGAVGSVTGNVGGNVIGFVGSVNTNGISAASLAADAGTEIATSVWANVTRELTSGLNIVLAKGVGVTGFNDLSAAQVNTEADTALSDIFLDRLFAVDYNPAAEPGVAGAFLNEATENDLGAIRYTTQMLENAPAGGGGGGSDWSVGEKEQIRHRIGIDGTASAPTATPSLASAASIAALNNLSAVQVRDSVSEDIGNVSRGCIEAVLLSFAAGDISTTGQTTTWRDPSNGEVRITSVVTSNGNRTATITCPTY